MIPLSRWLTDRGTGEPSAFPLLHEAIQPVTDDSIPLTTADEAEAAAASNRDEELAEALRRAEETLTSERRFHARREEMLREELGTELACLLTARISKGVRELQQELEAALADVLRPFLAQRATKLAISALARLIETELQSEPQPVLEVRAPRDLHDLIRPAMETAGLSTSLSDASRIEVVFKSRTSRFEQLASRWHGIITEHET